jgi:hypothetical protein
MDFTRKLDKESKAMRPRDEIEQTNSGEEVNRDVRIRCGKQPVINKDDRKQRDCFPSLSQRVIGKE